MQAPASPRIRALYVAEICLCGLPLWVVAATPEARRVVSDAQYRAQFVFSDWAHRVRSYAYQRRELPIGSRVEEFQISDNKLVRVTALGMCGKRCIDFIQNDTGSEAMKRIYLVMTSEDEAKRIERQLSLPNVSVYADSEGKLHKRLNAYFVPRWFLFGPNGALLSKQSEGSALGGCGCGGVR